MGLYRTWTFISGAFVSSLVGAGCGGDPGLDESQEGVVSTALVVNEYRAGSDGFIEVLNATESELDLSGYAVDDGPGGSSARKLSGKLAPHAVKMLAYSGINVTSADRVRVLAADGSTVDDVWQDLDGDRKGRCLVRLNYPWYPDPTPSFGEAPCTPGDLNSSLKPGDLRIEEFKPGDFVEFRNMTQRVIPFSELGLARADDGPGRHQPGYLTDYRWQASGLPPGEIGFVFYRGISGTTPEKVELSTAEGIVLDSYHNFIAQRGAPATTGKCFGRLAGGVWSSSPIPCSPGERNAADAAPGKVLINEYQAGTGGFVELVNVGESPFELRGYQVDDIASGGTAPASIPATTIAPGGFLQVKYSGINRTSADDVRLVDPSGTEVDKISTSGSPGTACYGRSPDGGPWKVEAVTCSPGASNGGSVTPPPPATCSATPGNFGGVAFTQEEACRAIAFMNEARFTDLYKMGHVASETAFFCGPTGCGDYRRGGWQNLTQFDETNYGGGTPGGSAFLKLRESSTAFVSTGARQRDTIADVWARRTELGETQIILESVFIERLLATPGLNDSVCAVAKDSATASNYLKICNYVTSCHDGSCSGPTAPDLTRMVGQSVWVQGRLSAYRGSYEMHNLLIRPLEGTQPGTVSFITGTTGRAVQLGETAAVNMPLTQEVSNLTSEPTPLPTFAGAYKVDPATLASLVTQSGTPTIVADAFIDALGTEDLFAASDVAIAGAGAGDLDVTLQRRLATHVPPMTSAQWAPTRATYRALAASMTSDGVTHAFQVGYEDSGDYSYVAVVAVNATTGDLRLFGFRRDP